MKITRTSPLTGKVNIMELPITENQLQQWHSGAHIQDVMPNLSPAEREFIMTGYTQSDWDAMFGDIEDR